MIMVWMCNKVSVLFAQNHMLCLNISFVISPHLLFESMMYWFSYCFELLITIYRLLCTNWIGEKRRCALLFSQPDCCKCAPALDMCSNHHHSKSALLFSSVYTFVVYKGMCKEGMCFSTNSTCKHVLSKKSLILNIHWYLIILS